MAALSADWLTRDEPLQGPRLTDTRFQLSHQQHLLSVQCFKGRCSTVNVGVAKPVRLMFFLIIIVMCLPCLGVPSHLGVAAWFVLFLALSLLAGLFMYVRRCRRSFLNRWEALEDGCDTDDSTQNTTRYNRKSLFNLAVFHH